MSDEVEFQLPEIIEIGSQLYEVVVTELPDLRDSSALTPHTRQTGKRLWMRPDYCNLRAMLLSFLHECVHAIDEEYGVDLDEAATDRLAQGMVQCILALVEAQE